MESPFVGGRAIHQIAVTHEADAQPRLQRRGLRFRLGRSRGEIRRPRVGVEDGCPGCQRGMLGICLQRGSQQQRTEDGHGQRAGVQQLLPVRLRGCLARASCHGDSLVLARI